MVDSEEIMEYMDFLEGMELMDVFRDADFNYMETEEANELENTFKFDTGDEQYKYGLHVDAREELHAFYVGEPSESDKGNTNDEVLQCIINMIELEYILNDEKECKIRYRRWGVHPINQLRREHGHFENLVAEMMAHDHDKFFNFTRMSPERFDYLLALIGPKITKRSPNAIPAKGRLLITLRFLATGDCMKTLHYDFRVGVSTAFKIIYETCDVLWHVLSPIYLKYPTEAEWVKIAAEFKEKLCFPNCCGAMDGKHIEIYAPKHSGSMYYNYLNYFSTVLLAVCDANKNFTYVDIGAYGTQSDGGVMFHSTFGKRLDSNNLNLPPPTALPHTNQLFPFFFIADAAFPLKENILTPYVKKGLNKTESKYNKEHSSVRKVVENIFAILVKRWNVLSGPIAADPSNVDKIVKATVVLHNFIKSFEDKGAISYMRANRSDKVPTTEGLCSFYECGLRYNQSNASAKAHNQRDVYSEFLNNIY